MINPENEILTQFKIFFLEKSYSLLDIFIFFYILNHSINFESFDSMQVLALGAQDFYEYILNLKLFGNEKWQAYRYSHRQYF